MALLTQRKSIIEEQQNLYRQTPEPCGIFDRKYAGNQHIECVKKIRTQFSQHSNRNNKFAIGRKPTFNF